MTILVLAAGFFLLRNLLVKSKRIISNEPQKSLKSIHVLRATPQRCGNLIGRNDFGSINASIKTHQRIQPVKSDELSVTNQSEASISRGSSSGKKDS